MKRAGLVIVALLMLAGTAYWWISRGVPASDARTDEQRAADAWLALRIQIFAAGADDDLLVEVTAYDRRARQAAAIREAAGDRHRGSVAAAPVHEARPLPEGWLSRVRIEAAGASIPHAVMAQHPDGRAVLRVEAARAPADATPVVAVLAYEEGEARSNTVSVTRAPDAPAERLVALGWQAELLSDLDRLATVGTDLVTVDPTSPWGHYFSGVVLEARGDREAALAAFRRALALTTPGYEPPLGLVMRIGRLTAR